MAAEVPPSRIDKVTELLRVEAEGETIRYVYKVETDAPSLSASVQVNIVSSNCANELLGPVIHAGATLEHRYESSDGSDLGIVLVTQAICDNPPDIVIEKPQAPDIDEVINNSALRVMHQALEDYFPEDAIYLRDQMQSVIDQGENADEAENKILLVGTEIRRRHAASLRSAPDPLLRKTLSYQVQMISSFQDDRMLCNKVVMYGASAIPQSYKEVLSAALESSGTMYQAMFEGENSPIKRGLPTDGDWVELVKVFYENGGTDAELSLVMEPDIHDPDLCSGTLVFLRSVMDAEFPGAHRLRAEMVARIAEG
jgi:hypothetical protein